MTIEYFWLEAIWILALIFANGFSPPRRSP